MAPALAPARVLVVIAGIYTTQSVIGAMTFHGVPSVLRTAGAGLDIIGMVYLLMLPWALKFLWSPAIERYRLPASGARRSRHIIVAGQIIAIATIFGLALVTPGEGAMLLFAALAFAAIVTATVDIACDGFAVQQLKESVRGWGNVMQVGGGYIGAMLGGGLFLVLIPPFGWSIAVVAMVVLLIVLTLPAVLTPEPRGNAAEQAAHRPSLADAFSRPAIRMGLLIVVIYQAGLRVGMGMTGPFAIDRGFDLTMLGYVSGIFGTIASLIGTLLAGFAIRRFGADRLLLPLVLAQAVLFTGFALVSLMAQAPLAAIMALLIAKAVILGAVFVTLYTAMMGWSSLRQAGVDFTLFQCADAAIAALAGLGGGVLAQALGYRATFALAAACALIAAILLPFLLRRTR
jgi:MFS transporter (putative signal transducer)